MLSSVTGHASTQVATLLADVVAYKKSRGGKGDDQDQDQGDGQEKEEGGESNIELYNLQE